MSPTPALTPDQARAAESLLADAWGGPVRLKSAEILANRRHVVRLTVDDGRTAILKRPRQADSGGRWGDEPQGLATEWAALALLAGMAEPVAPRLIGGDSDHQIVVMEDLSPERSLADSLLGGDADRARTDLVTYAKALAEVAAWTFGRGHDVQEARLRRGLDPDARSWWVGMIERYRHGFVSAARELGLAAEVGNAVEAEIDEIERILDGGATAGFVHGDPCPDNVVIVGGRCRLLDFERSSWGSVALDAGYLVAPFPSCWCFGRLRAEVAEPALTAYRETLRASVGAELGPEWDQAVAAALAAWLVVRGDALARAWGSTADDSDWGTTTMRPRLRAWVDSFLASPGAGHFPRLLTLAAALADRARSAWPDVGAPDYPGLAQPGAPVAHVPAGWVPSSDRAPR